MKTYGPWVLGDTATAFVYTPKGTDGVAYAPLATATAARLVGKSPTTRQNIDVAGTIAAPIVTFAAPLAAGTLPGSINRDAFVCRVKITNSGGAISWQSEEMVLELVRFPA